MGKKQVNIELNMTPFIGLFALLVVMLLLTAVWNHILALSTNTSAASSSNESVSSVEDKVNFSVVILSDKVQLVSGKTTEFVEHVAGAINKEGLIFILEKWKSQYPDRSDVILSTQGQVNYKQLIETFDTLVGNGWPDVGVSTQ